jgi:hypothetical protein
MQASVSSISPTASKTSHTSTVRKVGVSRSLIPKLLAKKKKREKHLESAVAIGNALQALMVLSEYKEPNRVRSKEDPSVLQPPYRGYSLQDTKESSLLRGALSSFFSEGEYTFSIKTILNMSSSGTGIVNSVIANSALNSVAEFGSLALVFSSYFIDRMDVRWQPVSLYNYPLTGSSTISVSSLPIGVASLQHNQAAYTSLGTMSNAARFQLKNTGEKFGSQWVNIESPSSTVELLPGSATQAWNNTANAVDYTGTLQFLSQSAPPALPFTQVLGSFAVMWKVRFRNRF